MLLKARVLGPKFFRFHLILRSYDYNMHVEGLLSASVCLVTLLFIKLGTMFTIAIRSNR